jgi:plasmid replication initiation protein
MDTLELELLPTPACPDAYRAGPRRRVGRDELNLAEFPFALLHSRPPKNPPLALEFRDGDKEWTVEGSPKYGLPLAPDIEVYVVLMEITREQGFPVQVEFCRRELIRRLGWDPNGRSYERLTLALDRLVSVTIRTRNAFFDAEKRRWSSKEAFHILDRYKIADGTLPGQEQPTLFPSWIRWSDELYANLRAGYIKTLDVNLFLSLRSSIAQALYRFLDKKRGGDGKPLFRMALKTLVFEHLGLSRTYFPSEAKHKLKPAHEELISVGFLAGVDFAPMKSGEEMVIYRFAPAQSKAEGGRSLSRDEGRGMRDEAPDSSRIHPSSLCPHPSQLAQRLIDAGVSRQTAIDLAGSDPAECERQLQYLPYREARDPGALLGKAIREGWSAPPAWTQAQQKEQAAAGERQKRLQAAAAAERRAAEETDFDRWWAALDPAKQAEFTARAMADLRRENSVLIEMARRRPGSPTLQASLRPLLKKHSGWPGGVQRS